MDSLTADLPAAPRRIALHAIAAAGNSFVAHAGQDRRATVAKKKNKSKKRRCRRRKKGGPVTCADVRPAEGGFTFHLFGGGDVCATGAVPSDCFDCDDDSDCVTVGPTRMCAKDFTNLATGAVGDFSGLCGSYTRGICVAFEPCVHGS
jgi:hypothetical protein